MPSPSRGGNKESPHEEEKVKRIGLLFPKLRKLSKQGRLADLTGFVKNCRVLVVISFLGHFGIKTEMDYFNNMIKKLKRLEVEEKLKFLSLEVFTPLEFKGVFSVSMKTAANFISSNLESGLFVKLRNGFYILKDSRPDYYFIANKLYQPSYVSLETALSYHKLIPETVYGNTSITTKTSREFETPIGNFTYRHIKTGAFTGYGLQEADRYKVLIAEPEKALADYLYFVDLKKLSLNDRLKLGKIDRRKLAEYAKLFKRPGMLKLINKIYADSRKPREIY